MNADFFYQTAPGRAAFQTLQKLGFFRLGAWFLHTRASRLMIGPYIRRNAIDMTPYGGQAYGSFAAFFSRTRGQTPFDTAPNVLISPCDGLLSVYGVTEDLTIPMKGSVYTLGDLAPDARVAEQFQNGLCLVFRLEASDYHHFCCFDDCRLAETHAIPGQLHSVQPIALRSVPVFRLNRRWWTVLETDHFGTAVQVEVGAMMVGGVAFSAGDAMRKRGSEMGCFTLAGSTIILLLNESVRRRLRFREALLPCVSGQNEVRVRMGAAIGTLEGPDFTAFAIE